VKISSNSLNLFAELRLKCHTTKEGLEVEITDDGNDFIEVHIASEKAEIEKKSTISLWLSREVPKSTKRSTKVNREKHQSQPREAPNSTEKSTKVNREKFQTQPRKAPNSTERSSKVNRGTFPLPSPFADGLDSSVSLVTNTLPYLPKCL
jgi:hypothetical protein